MGEAREPKRDPFGYVVGELGTRVAKVLGVEPEKVEALIVEPPRHVGADLCVPLMRLTRDSDLAAAASSEVSSLPFVERAETQRGYLNVWIKGEALSEMLFGALDALGDSYGIPRIEKKLKIVVEHTSANPVHPLHIGHARNACIGDSLARLLEFVGHDVERRFYVNDVGRQTALLVYGLMKLGGPSEWRELMGDTKSDHWFGLVYALTNLLVELRALRKRLEEAETDEEKREVIARQDALISRIARVAEKSAELFSALSSAISKDEDPEEEISKIMRSYEAGEEPYKSIVREAITLVLRGFEETLGRLEIKFDKWDFESEVVWEGLVDEVSREASRSRLLTVYKDALALDLTPLASTRELRERLRIPAGLEVPPLILRRRDGTTLYTTRDIAYTLKKFGESGADVVINVIAKEQTLPQAQLRLALYALGYASYAERLIHYSHELVSVPGLKMSARLGEYISVDEVLDMLEARLRSEYSGRGREVDGEAARALAAASLRYYLVSVDADKPLELRLSDVLDPDKNTAPYLMYSYARACGILRKAEKEPVEAIEHFWASEFELRRELVKRCSQFPYVVRKASHDLKPSMIAEYVGELARVFNKWYDEDPVLSDPLESRKRYKIALVRAVRIVLSNSMRILGIKPLERV
ncbi:MAG: arginine--tRNA ligase [Fervidicoccaceae archaeon]